MQKDLVLRVWLTGPLSATVWWLQLSAAMCAGSAATWQASTAAVHAVSAPFYTAHLPIRPATSEEVMFRYRAGYATVAKLNNGQCFVHDEHCHSSCMQQLRAGSHDM